MDHVVVVKNLVKRFGVKEVFNGLNFEVARGSMIAIQGKSGSGKSTLLNIIGRIEKQSSGDVIVLNRANILPNSRAARMLLRDEIAFLFQNYALIDNQIVEANLKIGQHYAHNKEPNQINEALRSVGLEGYNKNKIYTLSGGEQQRVALARVMIKPCALVLADEPTGNVDVENKRLIMDLFKKIQNQGKTIIVVTHDHDLDHYFDAIINI